MLNVSRHRMAFPPTTLTPLLAGVLLAVALILTLGRTAVAGGTHLISAAKEPYFVCDDRVIEDRWQLERFVVPPTRHAQNPLIVREHSWEGTGPHLGGSVLYDPEDTRFKMWYSVWNKHAYYNRLPFSYNVCYAESQDGIVWKKPALGLFDDNGNRANNCIRLGTDKTQNIDVCLNPVPDELPGRFLAIHNQKGGVFVSHSVDGKEFHVLQKTPAIPYHSDTHNNFVYDEQRDNWLLFCRPRAWAGDHRRRVAFQQSRDLRSWSHEQTILVPSENEKPEFYGMSVFRRGDLFFGQLKIYDRTTGFMHIELAWSPDGTHWQQIATHPPFLDRGPAGSWEAGMVLPAESPVQVGDQLWFYYGGFRLDHNTTEENIAAIGLAVTDRDRLVGLRPLTAKPGFCLTRPFSPSPNAALAVNAIVRGKLAAEIRKGNNKTVKGFSFDECKPVTVSGFQSELRWNGKQLHDLPSGEVRILFRLEDAELFSFSVSPSRHN